MTSPITTFSGFERAANCPGSVALPHAEYSSPASDRGTALHAYLEAIPTVGAEAALAEVPEQWREAATAIDLTGLDDRLSLAAEVSYAYDVETDTARELGRGLNRNYEGIKDSEIPGTVDVVGVDQANTHGLYIDWKFGWQVGKKGVRNHWQLDTGALAIARTYGLDTIDAQLGHIRENEKPFVKRKVIDALGLDLIADDVRQVYEKAKAQRELVAAGKMPTGLRAGDWCTWCPARNWCPVRTSMIRAVVSSDEWDDLMRIRPMSLGQVPEAWRRIRAAKKIINAIEAACYAAARENPVLLGRDDDGTEHWLGYLVDEGNEQIDGRIAHAVLTELHGAEAADKAVTLEATKKAIEDTLKPIAAALGRGKFAGLNRAALDEIRARGGITRKQRDGVREYEVKGKALKAG